MKPLFNLFILSLFVVNAASAQDYINRFKGIDIQHYNLHLKVNDSTDVIEASMDISVRFKKLSNKFDLDLVSLDTITGLGMEVTSVVNEADTLEFVHRFDRLAIATDIIYKDTTITYTINYKGIPKDGFIISKNKHGDRTFFGDNWPNRAHHWFPCVDHPSDKATVAFNVTAPNRYKVIANGAALGNTENEDGTVTYNYKSSKPIPTKVMVAGIADFAVQNIEPTLSAIPVSSWVYPQQAEEGFRDFAVADSIIHFFEEKIGPFPFDKLANVQSKTRYGGMENAGCIFYNESAITGEQNIEALIAHEIAHQWFGNSVSEQDWPHVWLSEGFATYFANVYMEHKYGVEELKKRAKEQRDKIFTYNEKTPGTVIPRRIDDLNHILNTNTYQKGGWVLHMLRNKVGEDNFWRGIREYYKKYNYGNATTAQFKRVMEANSGEKLDTFFNQWLTTNNYPELSFTWVYYKGVVRIIIDQKQETPMAVDLDIELTYEDGTTEIKKIFIEDKLAPYRIEDCRAKVVGLKYDPNITLLVKFENK